MSKWPCPTWSSNSFLPEAHLLSIHYQCIDSGKNTLCSTRLERTTRLIICTTLLTRLFAFIINKQDGQATCHLSNSIFSLDEKFYFWRQVICLKLVPRNTVRHFYYVKCFSLAQHSPFLQEYVSQAGGSGILRLHTMVKITAPSMPQYICFPAGSTFHVSWALCCKNHLLKTVNIPSILKL